MNFQDLKTVDRANDYLDRAFKKSKVKIKEKRDYFDKIESFSSNLRNDLDKIIFSFPNLDNLPEFYQELIDLKIDRIEIKKALGTVNWAKNKLLEFTSMYKGKLRGEESNDGLKKHMNAYYGRISSLMKRLDKALVFLEYVRRELKAFPSIKTSIPTVMIYGFPNVGKTTLLNELTGTKADVENYAFTTQFLNLGYIKTEKKKIQLIDSPGVLGRPKKNEIEKITDLALKYCADTVLFVMDDSYYEMADQEKLLKKLKKKFLGRKDFIEFRRGDSVEELKKTLLI